MQVLEKNVWGKILEVFRFSFSIGEIKLNVGAILIIIIAFIITKHLLRVLTKLISKQLSAENKIKFKSLFSFAKYFIYAFVGIIVFDSIGVNLTPILAASTALLVGVGLALQTLFQDIISGVFIIIDKSIKVGDIIQLGDHIGKVEEIKLRTTRTVTFDNKVLIIPNHKYLTTSLYNWTQNGKEVKDNVVVGVAYGSDTGLVKSLLLKAAERNSNVLKKPVPIVVFEDFADNSLQFKLFFSVKDSFYSQIYRSEIRYAIDELFRENNIEIPFPQRVVYNVGN